jgi:exonuclease III
MKIVSWNVRGLGGFEKRKEVKKLVVDKRPFIVCLQETKLMQIDNLLCSSLWGGSSHDFSYRPSVGASGGLLIMWDLEEVSINASFSFDHVLVVQGRFLKSQDDFVLFNVYAPCDGRSQSLLWDSLSAHMSLYVGCKICVCGDFNVVRGAVERKSIISSVRSQGGVLHDKFNDFIDREALVDLPLIGRRFTWYRGDGQSMSRIERFLLSEAWCLRWPNSLQVAQLRCLSNHCALVLSVDEQNWGPKPFRMLKCWVDVPGYKDFMSSRWRQLHVNGWGGYVLKEKLKLIKVALR